MRFQYDDGGRAAAGFKGSAGDCVVRAIAIASGRPYQEVYDDLFVLNRRAGGRKGNPKRCSPRDGNTSTKTIRRYLAGLGWRWVPTMEIGSGCKVHLTESDLPTGRLVVRLSKHLTAVVDGVIHDTYDPQRFAFDGLTEDEKIEGVGASRCVYGYWTKKPN